MIREDERKFCVCGNGGNGGGCGVRSSFSFRILRSWWGRR